MKKVIAFDLDGTLVDTERVAMETLEEYCRELQIVLSEEDHLFIVGRKWSLGVEYLVDKYSIPKTAIELETEAIARYRQKLANDLPSIKGAAEFVRSLYGKYRLFCVSGSHRSDIEFALRKSGIFDCFEGIVGCEDYRESKPSPEAYLTALKRFGLSAEEVLVFEDSKAGVESALAAELPVIRIENDLSLEVVSPFIKKRIPHYENLSPDSIAELFLFSK